MLVCRAGVEPAKAQPTALQAASVDLLDTDTKLAEGARFERAAPEGAAAFKAAPIDRSGSPP